MIWYKLEKNRRYELFKILLSKLPRNPTNLEEIEIISLYKRAIWILKTYNKLEELYENNPEDKIFNEWST